MIAETFLWKYGPVLVAGWVLFLALTALCFLALVIVADRQAQAAERDAARAALAAREACRRAARVEARAARAARPHGGLADVHPIRRGR